MASFESTRSQYTQEHFEVLEIDLPVITGTCTLGASDGFGTPLTCDQAWTGEYKTYKFTNQNAPLLSGSIIYRAITSIRENTTEIKPGKGLSARGSLSVTFSDFKGDPNDNLEPLESTEYWPFNNSLDGFEAQTGTANITTGPTAITLTNEATTGILRTPTALNIQGVDDYIVVTRIRCTSHTLTGNNFTIYYDATGPNTHGESGLYQKRLSNITMQQNEWKVLLFDMRDLTAGGTDWVDSVINRVRLDIAAPIGYVFELDYFKIGHYGVASNITPEVINQGTFFGKLNARQVIENKAVRLKLYRVEANGTIDLAGGAETHHYITESLKSNNNGTWSLQCKDVLSLANLNEKVWPPTAGGTVRQDFDDAVVAIPVDANVDYSNVFAVRIGDEFMKVNSVTDNLGAAPFLNVPARGTAITAPVSGKVLTQTIASSHSAGDEVFVCDLSDDETIDSLLTRILVASDFDAALIPAADWAAEVTEWHASDKINTLHSESEDVNDAIERILTGFLMDMWFDQIDNQAKLSAISVWKESAGSITEGKEIDAYTLKDSAEDSLRASRALVIYDKKNLAENDDVSSFKKAAQFSDSTIITEALYKEHKDKRFDNNVVIDTNAAELLVQRYVSRFKFTPFTYKWTTQERFLTFKTGDVVDLNAVSIQSANGLPSTDLRAQITKVTPKYTNTGRVYDCTAMSYEAAFNNNSEIVLDSPLGGVNFYTLAGAPSQAVTLTFILKGTHSSGGVAMAAGAFPSGSKIILILTDGFDGQAKGGDGGIGVGEFVGFATQGKNGGIVYDAQGVDTDIYFSGATPSLAHPVADGYIRAPGGGGGASTTGNGGGGGAGRLPGVGGDTGGSNGTIIGTGGAGSSDFDLPYGGAGGGWGQAGVSSDSFAGAAGRGIKDSGATVTLFGSDATRYINGNGDHP